MWAFPVLANLGKLKEFWKLPPSSHFSYKTQVSRGALSLFYVKSELGRAFSKLLVLIIAIIFLGVKSPHLVVS